MDFTKYLRSKRAYVVKTPGYTGSNSHNFQMVIPPLNTDIRFADVLPEYEPPKEFHQPATLDFELPSDTEMYDPKWVNILDKLRAKNGLIESYTPPLTPKFVIPPLNTDIRFDKLLPRFVDESRYDPKNHTYTHVSTSGVTMGEGGPAGDPEHIRGKIHIHSHIHENFSWTIPTTHDDDEAVKKKLLSHPVFDQQGCGSCWAVSVATTMSDCLVVGETINRTPFISPTFCMACYPQGMCAGGMPAQLALDIQSKGVADTTCLDYSWCQDNQICNVRDSSAHFDIDPAQLSNMIPDCSCTMASDKLYYYLDEGTDTFSITDDTPPDTYRQIVKYHILDFGPVVGGYLVLDNFIDGKFTQINKGVYFDRADYSNVGPDGIIPFSNDVNNSKNSRGLHAVSIVGWGVAKDIQYDTNTRGDVPFWYCRNSWGKNWGEHGFFKIAMYPFNKISQFDKVVTVKINNQPSTIGGLMLIRATSRPKIKKFF
jgi:hypothetical protein